MDFTESNAGDRATPSPDRRFVAAHQGLGVWHVHRLDDNGGAFIDELTVHAGSSDANLVWHPRSNWILFCTAESALLFCLDGRGGDAPRRGPREPDGIIRETRFLDIARAIFLDNNVNEVQVAIELKHGMGFRVWTVDWKQQHDPVLSAYGKCAWTAGLAAVLHQRSLLLCDMPQWTVLNKWRVPDGATIDGLVFLPDRRHWRKGALYTLLAWQGTGTVTTIIHSFIRS